MVSTTMLIHFVLHLIELLHMIHGQTSSLDVALADNFAFAGRVGEEVVVNGCLLFAKAVLHV